MKRSVGFLSVLGLLLTSTSAWAADASSCLPAKGVDVTNAEKANEVSSLEDPGAVQLSGMAACISSVDGNFAWLRDVVLATDVEWLDRGYRGTFSGTFLQVWEQDPLWRKGDLLFASMGMAGIFVFDVSDRRLSEFNLVGHLHIQNQSALLLQYDPQRGVVYAGGNDYGKEGRPPLIAAWDIRYVNAAPKIDYKPAPSFTVNKPWRAGHLAVDPTGMGLLYTWSNSEGPIAVPIEGPEFRFSGLYLPEKEDLPVIRTAGDVLPSIQKITSKLVPLGVPRVVKREDGEPARSDERDELEAEYTAAFKVRLALPGSLGETLTAKVESLRVLPERRHLGKADLGGAVMPPGGPGWPDASVTVTLRRLGVGQDEGADPVLAGGEAGHFSEAYNLYESVETVLLLADPRARRGYRLQDVAGTNDRSRKHDEKADCRNCDWPQYLPDPKGPTPPAVGSLDDVKELLAGRFVRAALFVDPSSPLAVQNKTQDALNFFEAQGDNYPLPAGYVETAAPAAAVASPLQVTLAEPAQNPAMWSPGEAGASATLVGGDLIINAADHVIGGRGLAFTFDRVYRSHSLGYGPLGSAGWGANLFAHLREMETTGEVEYHDGRGHVWRFYPNAAEDAQVPDEDLYAEDFTASYHPPEGVYLRLQKLRDDRGWRLIGRSHDTAEFDADGRLIRISDRHRRGQDPSQQGNSLTLRYDAYGRLVTVHDDLQRTYSFEYFGDPRPRSEGGDGERYGLLETITDFADRELKYEYDLKRRLTKVHYPEVKNPVEAYKDFSYEGPKRPFLEYTYDPENGVTTSEGATDAILHGKFAELRLSEVFLPDFIESPERAPRARFNYDNATGRLKSVGFPTPANQNNGGQSVVWTLLPSAQVKDDAGPADLYTVRAPWGHDVEYTLTDGRSTRVEQLLDVVEADGLMRQDVVVGTDFVYMEDGRLERITYPDGGERLLCYADSEGGIGGCDPGANEDVDHLAKANVFKSLMRSTTPEGKGTADYTSVETGATYQEDNLVASMKDGLNRGIQMAVPMVNTTDTRLFQSEGVQSSYDYDEFGRVTDTTNGVSNASKTKKIFDDDASGKSGAGLPKRLEVGGGKFWNEVDYDDQYNPVVSVNSQGVRSETTFDTWDRAVRTIGGRSDGRYRAVGSLECSEDGARVETAFDAAGHVVRERRLQDYVDFAGTVRCRWVETRYQYNAREQVVAVEQTHVADPTQPGRVLIAPTKITESIFDEHGRLRIRRDLNMFDQPLEAVHRYDSAGRIRGVRIGDAGELIRGYDSKSRVVFESDGDEGIWLGRYDVWDRLYHQKHTTGAYDLSHFDKSGNLKQSATFEGDPLGPAGDAVLLSLQRTHFNSFGKVERIASTLIDEDEKKQVLVTEQEFDDAGRLRAIWSGSPIADDPLCADVSVPCLDVDEARREKEIVYEVDTGRVLEERFGGPYGGPHLYATRNEYHPDNASPWVDRTLFLERVPGLEGLAETRSTDFVRDAFGRVITKRGSDGSAVHVTYDRTSSQPIRIASPSGAVNRISFDGVGKTLQVFRPNNRGTTIYLYDLDGRLLRQITSTETSPWVTRFTYDRTGRTRRIDYHDGTFEELTYEPDNEVATLKTRDGITITNTYDAANRLRTSVPSATTLPTSLVDLDAGNFWDWDTLSRPTSVRRGSAGTGGEDGSLSVAYPSYDLASRPGEERVGNRGAMSWTYDVWSRPETLTLPLGLSRDSGSSFQGFGFQFDTLDRLEDISAIGALTQATAGVTWEWGGASRPYGCNTKTALGTASRYGYIRGTGPQAQGDQPASSDWKLGTLTWGAGDSGAAVAPTSTWGQFAFGWRGITGEASDGAKIGREVKTGLDAGGLDLFAGMGWAWDYDTGVRLKEAYPGRGNLAGHNVDDGDGYVYSYGKGDEIDRIVDEAAGKISEIETGAYGRIERRDGVDFGYDGVGRRTEDDRHVYRWNWRSELMEVTVKDSWPNDEVSPYAGHQVRYAYDAFGRVIHRAHWGAVPEGGVERPFIERRDYVWEHQSLVSEVGFGDPQGTTKRWRKTFVPGLSGLDDAPQVMVENLAFPGSTYSKALYTYLRDELGTVVGIVAEEESQDPDSPTIPARYLYSVYGEARIETGPELRRARFLPNVTEVAGAQQSVGTEQKAGALRVLFSGAIDGASLGGAVVVEQLGSGGWQAVPAANVVSSLDLEPMTLDVMLIGGWDAGSAYRVRLGTGLRDVADRPLAEEAILSWSVPPSGALSIAYDERFAYGFDNVGAASDTLGGRFPGGQNHLFQGLWTDPVTGLHYARARWYDARNASWMSEDPLADIDSPNLYAFVAWQPNMATDPLGQLANFNIWDSGVEMVKEEGPKVAEEVAYMAVEEVGPIGILNGLSSAILGYDFVRDEKVEGFWPRALSLLGAVPGIPNNLRKADDVGGNAKHLDEIYGGGRAPRRPQEGPIELSSTGSNHRPGSSNGDSIRSPDSSGSCHCRCNCFTAGTPVATEDGSKPIEEVAVGDLVWARNPETGENELAKVVRLFEREAEKIYKLHVDGEVLEATAEHPFWADLRGWIQAEDLRVGDSLITDDDKLVRIDKIEIERAGTIVYNFEVQGLHTFFVGDARVLAHNCGEYIFRADDGYTIGDDIGVPIEAGREVTAKEISEHVMDEKADSMRSFSQIRGRNDGKVATGAAKFGDRIVKIKRADLERLVEAGEIEIVTPEDAKEIFRKTKKFRRYQNDIKKRMEDNQEILIRGVIPGSVIMRAN